MPLHLTKVAVGVASIEALENRIARRVTAAGEVRVPTRMRPKRMAELIGGSLHWIVKHRIVARQVILRFDDRSDGRLDIVCAENSCSSPRSPSAPTRAGAISPRMMRRASDGDADGMADAAAADVRQAGGAGVGLAAARHDRRPADLALARRAAVERDGRGAGGV